MTTDPPVLGLVAGDGVYPEYIVRGARRRTPELRIVAVGFKGETNPAVIPLCDAYQEFSVGQISKPFTFLKKHGVRNVIMAGGINPKNILSLRPDLRALSVLMRMPEKKCGLPAWGRHHGSGKGRVHHPPGLHLHGGAHAAAGAYRRTASHA